MIPFVLEHLIAIAIVLLLVLAYVLLVGVIWAFLRGASPQRACVVCGCTDWNACEGGCAWASLNPPVCTTCAPTVHVGQPVIPLFWKEQF